MSVTCPAGHTSTSTDYCDVCGAPLGTPSRPTAAPRAAVPTPSTCPHCGSAAASGALFCENCGYDFTTGATPLPAVPPAAGGVPAPTSAGSAAPGRPTPPPGGTSPSGGPTRAPLEPPAGVAPVPGTAPAGPGRDPLEPPPAVATPPGAASAPAPDPAAPLTPPPAGDAWVAELWVDPDWYAAQQSEDPMPSVGLPVLVPLRERSLLVGRPSASRNIRPQVDAGADTGVSRRHCQLNTDGHRWWVEDLQSSNGTFVARAGEALPSTPIRPGQRHELEDGDRLYLGSWTRMVVRRALPGEV